MDIGNEARRRRKTLSIETFKTKADIMKLMTLKIERLQKKSNSLEAGNEEMKKEFQRMEDTNMDSFKRMKEMNADSFKKMEGVMVDSVKRMGEMNANFKRMEGVMNSFRNETSKL